VPCCVRIAPTITFEQTASQSTLRLRASDLTEVKMNQRGTKLRKIAFFGHFDSTNFGNESTLQAILYHLRCFDPDVEVTCISTGPAATIATHHIEPIPISWTFLKSWVPRNLLIRVLRKACIGLSEPFHWIKGFIKLRRTDMLIIPGTGLLTDAYGVSGWGPYNLFKWSFIAKICRCKVAFVSVGAGPIYGMLGKCLARSVLSLADFRSYRDDSTRKYLKSIGFRADHDRVYPDLAFSFPKTEIPYQNTTKSSRLVVGLGLMEYAGRYSVPRPNNTIYLAYLENLARVATWLLAHKYDVRLLSGDVGDTRAREDLKGLLRGRLSACDEGHVIDEPICSVGNLLAQIAATDIVVGTRFHNIVLALLCDKPVIAISFHHKCDSLMSAMGLSEYCLNINDLTADGLVEKFCEIETNADKIKPLIREKTNRFREALDEQYKIIFESM
jgi:polysaccharide pyruvyl transferase WcaK-like protein